MNMNIFGVPPSSTPNNLVTPQEIHHIQPPPAPASVPVSAHDYLPNNSSSSSTAPIITADSLSTNEFQTVNLLSATMGSNSQITESQQQIVTSLESSSTVPSSPSIPASSALNSTHPSINPGTPLNGFAQQLQYQFVSVDNPTQLSSHNSPLSAITNTGDNFVSSDPSDQLPENPEMPGDIMVTDSDILTWLREHKGIVSDDEEENERPPAENSKKPARQRYTTGARMAKETKRKRRRNAIIANIKRQRERELEELEDEEIQRLETEAALAQEWLARMRAYLGQLEQLALDHGIDVEAMRDRGLWDRYIMTEDSMEE